MKPTQWYLQFFAWSLVVIKGYAHQEFLYPAAVIDHGGVERICVLYQKNSHLELWLWDPQTQEAVKGLLSSFTPAGLRVLPHRSAFSFIDHDRIRIKDLAKRSPRAIDLPYGPYDLSTIEWIDIQSFYFSARERGQFSIFHATIEGELYRLTSFDAIHYMYPQKQGENLFFVTKKEDGSGSIELTEYPIDTTQEEAIVPKTTFKEQLKQVLIEDKDKSLKIAFNDSPRRVLFNNDNKQKEIAFLTMINPDSGFFLMHPTLVNKHDLYMNFECYSLEKKEQDIWQNSLLFEFRVPLHLLMPVHNQSDRLYESLLPLLPIYYKNTLYYSNDIGNGLDIYKYEYATGQTQKVTELDDIHHFFSPLVYHNKLYYGGTVCHGDGLSHVCPQMWINEQGEQRFVFPCVPE